MNIPPVYAGEFRRCILELDVSGIRQLWARIAPEMHQPVDDDEALHTLHLARSKLDNAPLELRVVSQAWLDARETRTVAYAVGVSVGAPPDRQDIADEVLDAMTTSAMNSYTSGLDLDKDADEVKSRMQRARHRVSRFRTAVRGHRLPGGTA